MRILMLSWEYPPRCVGGLANHVYHLANSLSLQGFEVHVITCEEGTAPIEESNGSVFVHRVAPYKVDTEDFVKWVMQLNFAMIEEGTRLINKSGKFDIIHAHDWLTAFSAKVLKWSFKIPLVSTIHGTEHGRNNGIRTEMQRYIASTEEMLANESWKIVACSSYMRHQVSELFKSPWDKIWIIPNGVDTSEFEFEEGLTDYRRSFACDDEKILFFIGRHVFEKGIHIFIEAIPEIANKFSKLKVIIAGSGPMTEELRHRVKELGLNDKVIFTGHVSEVDKNKLYRISDMAVFPSMYEPFGIVALEAMAAGCPVVVSGTGGLGEIVQHKYNGMKLITGSVDSVIFNVLELLNNNGLINVLKENGYNTLSEHYTWNRIAELTTKMYKLVIEEARGTEWETSGYLKKDWEVKDEAADNAGEESITVDSKEAENPVVKKARRGRKSQQNQSEIDEITVMKLSSEEKSGEAPGKTSKGSRKKKTEEFDKEIAMDSEDEDVNGKTKAKKGRKKKQPSVKVDSSN